MNRYDDNTRLIFHYAREEGDRLGLGMLEPAHLLLGILRLGGPVSELLSAHGLSTEQLSTVFQPSSLPAAHAPSVAPASRRLMEKATAQANRWNAEATGPVHILLALLDERDVIRLLPPELPSLLKQEAEELARSAPPAPVWQNKTALQLLTETAAQEGRPPAGLDRKTVLNLTWPSSGSQSADLLEDLIYRWLTDPTLSEAEKRQLIRFWTILRVSEKNARIRFAPSRTVFSFTHSVRKNRSDALSIFQSRMIRALIG